MCEALWCYKGIVEWKPNTGNNSLCFYGRKNRTSTGFVFVLLGEGIEVSLTRFQSLWVFLYCVLQK